MSNLPRVQTFSQLSSTWKASLDPVLANLLINGQLLSNIALANGTTAVDHKLGRMPNGWFLVSPQGAATVYQTAVNNLTLTLSSNAAITTALWVF